MAFPRRSTSNNAIGSPITDGTATRILYEGAGPVLADDANLTWDATNKQINVETRPLANLYITTGTLIDAQVKALPTTPVQVLASPGAGKRIMPVFAQVRIDPSAGAYTNVDATCVLKFGYGNVSPGVMGFGERTGFSNPLFVNGVTDVITEAFGQFLPSGENADLADSECDATLSVFIQNGALGNFTGGNAANRLRYQLIYWIWSLT